MKLIRIGESGGERPGVIADDGTRLDVSAFVADYDEMFFADDGLSRFERWLKQNTASAPRVAQSARLGSPSSTSEMVFDVPYLVSYVSQFMTLLPGDIMSTGTPAGVGLGMKPPHYLKAGDVVELGIDQFGESRQTVVTWNP
jgi:2-keto-4-pentenoate hydratase/2-oxohepta-3-ene-1,7-dioic acid hydratase in catechol pathway